MKYVTNHVTKIDIAKNEPSLRKALARGRNGYFYPAAVYVHSCGSGYHEDVQQTVSLEVNSWRGADHPPIFLRLPKSEMKKLGEALLEASR
jgi:hypothetical protein